MSELEGNIEVLVVSWLLTLEMDTVTWFQFLDEAFGISNSANTFGKGINLTILPPAMVK